MLQIDYGIQINSNDTKKPDFCQDDISEPFFYMPF